MEKATESTKKSQEIFKKVETFAKDELHKKLHKAFNDTDLVEVKKLLKAGVKLCYENSKEYKNCYVCAQDLKEPEFLNALLKYDKTGINAVDSQGQSLLLRDILIEPLNFRHAELLIDLGANVHYLKPDGENEISILHYATIIPETPINVIKKLIEHNADVNKQLKLDESFQLRFDFPDIWNFSGIHSMIEKLDEDTPLLTLLRNYDKESGFQKLKLLVESGADVNIKNNIKQTALMLAASLSHCNENRGLLKYLIEHGATGGISSNGKQALFFLLEISFRRLTDLDTKCLIPAIDLLIAAGDDLFMAVDRSDMFGFLSRCSPLSIVLHGLSTDCKSIVHITHLAFEKLKNGFNIDESHQIHPLLSILESMPFIMANNEFFSEISKLICQYPDKTNKFFMSANYFSVYDNNLHTDFGEGMFTNSADISYFTRKIKMTLFTVPMISFITSTLPFKYLMNWYQDLKDNNILLCNEDRSNLIQLLTSMNIVKEKTEISEYFIEMFNYFTNTLGIHIVSSEIKFKDSLLETYQNLLQLPDCIFIAALNGNTELLKMLLPYWTQHPLGVVLFLCPWLENTTADHVRTVESIAQILPLLLECGGQLSHGTQLHSFLRQYISEWQGKDLHNMYDPEPILKYLETHHENPASLRIMCRTVIRENAIGHGNNLPCYLASLVPHGLKNFLTLTEKY